MMKHICTGTCAAAIFALAVALPAAQTYPSTQSTPQSTSAKTITVTGCIQRAEQMPTGTSGAMETKPSTTAETKFILTNAVLSTTATTGTSGTTSTSEPATAAASEYRLDATDAKLSPHVGHKVEITGTVEQPMASAQEEPTTGSTQPATGSAAKAPKLKVDSVKMISSTCPSTR